jgi:hypothetical protein
MINERQNIRCAIIGVNGTGKSTHIVKRILPCYDMRSQKAIVVTETIDNPAYNKLESVNSLEQLQTLRRGPVKFWDFDEENDFMLLVKLHDIIARGALRNGVIVFEDCTNYVDANPHRIVKKFVVNHRMYNLDLFFTTHSLTDLPKWFRKRMNYLTLFKTGDNFRNENDVRALGYTNYRAVYEAWVKVMNHPNPHFNLTIAGL